MSSSPPTPSPAVCWNCDRPAPEFAVVTLRAPSGGQVILTLCRDCQAGGSVPLSGGAPELPAGHGQGPTVLVVDDDPDILAMLSHALRGNGYAVETAGNGLEALHKACQRMPAVVVLDLRMPVMDGHRFLAAWRQVTVAAPVPIVAISAQSRQPTAEELGVEAYLPKPFHLGMLIETIDSLLKGAA